MIGHMEDVNENRNVIKKEDVVLPFDSENFSKMWDVWKTYRKEIKKSYRGSLSEQAALKNLSKYSEEVAIKMIETS